MTGAIRRQRSRRHPPDGDLEGYISDDGSSAEQQRQQHHLPPTTTALSDAAATTTTTEEASAASVGHARSYEDGDDNAVRALPVHRTNLPVVACAILASITTGGTTYAFGLYGGALKKRLHLTQSQLDTISAVFFSAGLLSFVPGAIVDRFGARFGICTGGASGAVCLMLFWAVARGLVPSVSSDKGPAAVVAVLSVLNVGIFLSCALVTGSVFKIISCHCGPGTKGSAVGVAKGFVGLGSGAYACLFQSIRRPGMSDLDFLPLCAFFFVTAACFPGWMALPRKEHETAVPDVFTLLHFRVLYASLALLAVLIIGNALLGLYNDSVGVGTASTTGDNGDDPSPNYAMAGLLLFVWIAPIISLFYLPQRSDWERDGTTADASMLDGRGDAGYEQMTLLGENNNDIDDDETTDDGSNIGDISLEPIAPQQQLGSEMDEDIANDEGSDAADGMRRAPASMAMRRDKNLFQMLRTPSAWMMLWVTTVLCGAGTVETNNLGQMVESLGFSSVVTPATLALFSVAQSGSRIVTGAASEAALAFETRRCCIDRGVPRPFFFLVASGAAIVSHTILAVVTDQVLFVIGITLSGVAFGMIWPLMVLCVGEIFGTAHVGANYMFYDGFTSAAGTFILSKLVAQRVYEEHIERDGGDGGDGVTCFGKECFQQTHVIIVFLSVTCVAASLLMQYKTKNVYNTI